MKHNKSIRIFIAYAVASFCGFEYFVLNGYFAFKCSQALVWHTAVIAFKCELAIWTNHMAPLKLANIDSGNGLTPNGTKSLFKPMLNNH